MTPLDTKRAALSSWLHARGSVLVGFSGGVDSALLAVVAADVLGPERVLAVLGVSASLHAEVGERARHVAAAFGVRFREVETHELDDADYVANRGDRCFYCKQELWQQLAPIAREAGLAAIVDGTITDDLGEHRPGARAGANAGVESPLAQCGFTKDDVRTAARDRGLPLWDAPAAPCLASRLAVGVTVTAERLMVVGRAESALRALGIAGDLRVRHLGDVARIELAVDQMPAWQSAAQQARLEAAVQGAGFARVEFDARGYRRGSVNAADAVQPPLVEAATPQRADGDDKTSPRVRA